MPTQTNFAYTYVFLVFIWETSPFAIVWSVSDLHVMWSLLLRVYIALPLSVIFLLVLK
ncbi:EamA family transporter, partial [Acinetobacter baumannii]